MTAAAVTARQVREGSKTAVEVVTDALARAETHSDLNAFTRVDPDGSLERAAAVDRSVAAGEDPGPLAGIPVALKDLIDQAGVVTTAGSSFLRDPADADSPVATRLEAAGAVIIGRTGLHEFAYGFSSENDWWGPVRNPWDPATSPGGSSGGSAAAVAAGIVPIAIGTDTGGSVRVPAALCGVVGLKVTHGRIPLTGVFPLAPSLDTVGPITATAADAAVSYEVLAGHDPRDPWSAERTVAGSSTPLAGLRVAVPHPWVDRTLAPQQKIGFARFLEAVEEAGAEVHHVDEPALDAEAIPDGTYAEVADIHREWFTADPERYGPTIRDRLAAVFELDAAAIEEGTRWRTALRAAFSDLFRRYDLVATPATAARAKQIGVDEVDVGAGPEPYRPVLSWFTPLVNQAGLPAIVVPVATTEVDGLPPSAQLIGPSWSETQLLAAAIELDDRGAIAGSPAR